MRSVVSPKDTPMAEQADEEAHLQRGGVFGLMQRRRKTCVCLLVTLIIVIVLASLGAGFQKDVIIYYEEIKYQVCYAEEARAVSQCSGNGHKYGEASGEGCLCFQCFYEADCSKRNDTCIVNVSGPQTYLFESYWLTRRSENTLITGVDYRVPYTQIGDLDIDLPSPATERAKRVSIIGPHPESQANSSDPGLAAALNVMLRKVHAKFQNAVTTGRYLVFGTGATQLQTAAVWALSRFNQGTTYLYSEAPYDPTLKNKCSIVTNTCTFVSNSSALREEDNVIEVVTMPSTPDGRVRASRTNTVVFQSDQYIFDMSGYWPHLSPDSSNLTLQDNSLMLFSWSRLTGHAATRFGWAIVKDKQLADGMAEYIRKSSLDSSVDSAHRVLSVGNFLLANGESFFKFTDDEITNRWNKIVLILTGNADFRSYGRRNTGWLFLEYKGGNPSFLQDDLNYAFKKRGIAGTPGPVFGLDRPGDRPTYAMNILLHQQTFPIFLNKLCLLVKGDDATTCNELIKPSS